MVPTSCSHGQNQQVVHELRRLLERVEGFPVQARALPFGISALDSHLPQGGLAYGVPHEIVPAADGDFVAAFGFVVALLGSIPRGRPLLLVMSCRALAPSGRPFGQLYG